MILSSFFKLKKLISTHRDNHSNEFFQLTHVPIVQGLWKFHRKNQDRDRNVPLK